MFLLIDIVGPSTFAGSNILERRTSRLRSLICLVASLRTQSTSFMSLTMYYPLLRPGLQLGRT